MAKHALPTSVVARIDRALAKIRSDLRALIYRLAGVLGSIVTVLGGLVTLLTLLAAHQDIIGIEIPDHWVAGLTGLVTVLAGIVTFLGKLARAHLIPDPELPPT